jgi:hypothetical protein
VHDGLRFEHRLLEIVEHRDVRRRRTLGTTKAMRTVPSAARASSRKIKAGKLRPLAVTTATRLDVLPNVPTVADLVPGYEASGFAGISQLA